MANIIVLGSGLVGGVIAKDLAKQHNVTSVDISQKNLDKLNSITTICADISDTSTLHKLIKEFDLVIGAVPGFMGYKMMKDVIESGKISRTTKYAAETKISSKTESTHEAANKSLFWGAKRK